MSQTLLRNVVSRALLLLAFAATTAPRTDARAQSPTGASVPPPQAIDHGWEYRWGDSPKDEAGRFIWLEERGASADWIPIDDLPKVPGRDGQTYLWYCVRLPDVEWPQPTLHLPPVVMAFEAFVDTALVYRFGELGGKTSRYVFAADHDLVLPADYRGRTLSLRVYSDQRLIGVGTQDSPVMIGSALKIAPHDFEQSLETLTVGLVILFIGIAALLVAMRRRREDVRYPLYLGLLGLSMGVFYTSLTHTADAIIPSPAVHYYVRFLSYLMMPVWLYLFVDTLIGPSRVVRAMSIIQAVFAVVVVTLDAVEIKSMFGLDQLVNMLFAATITVVIATGVRAALSGNRDARVFVSGFLVAGLTGLHDILMGLGLFPHWHWISHWGTLVMMLHLAYISDRRYEEKNRLLKSYSRELEDKSAQLEEYAQTLEQKVTARTRDLDTKNSELASTLKELRETQQQLVLREKMASLGELVAGVAHEVNTPLGAVSSAADTAQRSLDIVENYFASRSDLPEGPEGERLRRALESLAKNNAVVSTASERINRIVQTLKNFSRLDEADFQLADIHAGLDSTLTLVHHQLKDRIEVVREYGSIPKVRCYPNELNQVFMNILVNAAQAIEGRGTITIRTDTEDGKVYVAITDTGHGIPADRLSRIFDPGFTTKGVGVGTGLGLSISYKIIEKHGGRILAESEPGRGTTMTIELPIRA